MKRYEHLTFQNTLTHYWIGAQFPSEQRKSKYNPKITTILNASVNMVVQTYPIALGEGSDGIIKYFFDYSEKYGLYVGAGMASFFILSNFIRIPFALFNKPSFEISLSAPIIMAWYHASKPSKAKDKFKKGFKNIINTLDDKLQELPKHYNLPAIGKHEGYL